MRDAEMTSKIPICPVCERPHIMRGFFGKFCSLTCRDFFERATFVCHLCERRVAHKYEDAHSRPCIEVRMEKAREEIRGKEGEIEGLAQELREVEKHG